MASSTGAPSSRLKAPTPASTSREPESGLAVDSAGNAYLEDILDGGGGDDELHGDDGGDLLFGRVGIDIVFGGAGVDRFSAADAPGEKRDRTAGEPPGSGPDPTPETISRGWDQTANKAA